MGSAPNWLANAAPIRQLLAMPSWAPPWPRKALAQQAEWLNRHPERSAIVEGHADEAGNGADLKALSAARAEAVRARLVEDGVAPQRIRVVAHGAERPVALCEDQSCASQNRRVATIIAPANTAQLPVK